jgi:hypothetical protein
MSVSESKARIAAGEELKPPLVAATAGRTVTGEEEEEEEEDAPPLALSNALVSIQVAIKQKSLPCRARLIIDDDGNWAIAVDYDHTNVAAETFVRDFNKEPQAAKIQVNAFSKDHFAHVFD